MNACEDAVKHVGLEVLLAQADNFRVGTEERQEGGGDELKDDGEDTADADRDRRTEGL